jgi:hypothetical protein
MDKRLRDRKLQALAGILDEAFAMMYCEHAEFVLVVKPNVKDNAKQFADYEYVTNLHQHDIKPFIERISEKMPANC